MYSSTKTPVEKCRFCGYAILLFVCILASNGLGQIPSPDDIFWSDKFFVSGLDNFDEGAALTVYNGNLIVGGAFEHADGIDARNVAGWNGTSWSPLGNGLDTALFALTVFSGQLVAGMKANFSRGGVVVWRDGTGWESLGGDFNGSVSSLIEYNGELIAAGSFSDVGGVPANRIAKWDGANWSPLGQGVTGGVGGPTVRELGIYNGKLIVGGTFSNAGGITASNIASWDGTSWDSLGAGILVPSGQIFRPISVESVVPFGGELYVGGFFSDSAGNASSNLTIWDGSIWKPFNCNYNIEDVTTMIVYDSSVIISGSFTDSFMDPTSNVLAWDGSTCVLLNEGTDRSIEEFAIYNGNLVAMGEFRVAGDTVANGIAQWDGAAWSNISSRQGLGVSYKPTGEGIRNLAIHNGELIASGFFTVAGDVISNRIVSWDGSVWNPIGIGNDSSISALHSSSNGLVVAGKFGSFSGNAFVMLDDGMNRTTLLDPSQITVDSSAGMPSLAAINSLTEHNGELIAAGQFRGIDGLTMNNIARWNGSNWLNLDNGLDGQVSEMIVYDSQLIVTGSFSTAGGVNADRIAAWDGTSWSAIGSGVGGGINAMAIYDGELVVGGPFFSAGGVATNRIARWNGVDWDSLGSGVSDSIGWISGLAVYENELVVTGQFDTAGGVSATNIAKWDGTSWSALGSGIRGDDDVHTLAVFQGNLMVGGDFSTAGGKASASIAQWNKPGPESCCVGVTGNIDCDPNDVIDIADLTCFIDYLFISFDNSSCFCCPSEANIDGDPSGASDIADLTFLIDHLFINFPPTAACQ